MSGDPETWDEQRERLAAMAADERGTTWDLSDNDRAAIGAALARLAARDGDQTGPPGAGESDHSSLDGTWCEEGPNECALCKRKRAHVERHGWALARVTPMKPTSRC